MENEKSKQEFTNALLITVFETLANEGLDITQLWPENSMPPSFGFLHSHPALEREKEIPRGHVVVDIEDWRTARSRIIGLKNDNTIPITRNQWDKIVAVLKMYATADYEPVLSFLNSTPGTQPNAVVITSKLIKPLSTDRGAAAAALLKELNGGKDIIPPQPTLGKANVSRDSA